MSADTPGFYVYMLRCADQTLYTGWTTHPRERLAVHNEGKGAKYTRSRLPVTMVYLEDCGDASTARRREWALKQLSRKQKLALIHERENALDENGVMECERTAGLLDQGISGGVSGL